AALEELADLFGDLILRDQDCFGSESSYEALLQLIPDSKVVQNLREIWSNDPQKSSEEKWNDFKSQIKKYPKGSAQRSVLTAAMEDIILQKLHAAGTQNEGGVEPHFDMFHVSWEKREKESVRW
ncbi:hypothetical protein MPER_01689, partial [Moniliophthora perniciosa FA553]